MTNTVNLNVEELKDFLRHMITNNQIIQSQGKTPVAVEVIGGSGIGKTSTILQIANELGLECIKLNLSQLEELGDLVGFPLKEFQVIKRDPKDPSKGTVKWADAQLLEVYLKEGYEATGKTQMSYAAPEWMADKKEGGILLLDDWSRADSRLITASMEILNTQEYISWRLPKNWHVILSANPDNGNYLVNSMDDAQKTRYISANLKFDIKCWSQWAEKEGIDG